MPANTDNTSSPTPPALDRNGVVIETGALAWLHGTNQGRTLSLVTGWDEGTGRPRVTVADPSKELWEVTVTDPGRLEITEPDPLSATPSDAWLILDVRDRVIGRTVGEQMADARRAAERLPNVLAASRHDGGFALRRLAEGKLTAGDRARLEVYRAALASAGGTRPVGEAVAVPVSPA
ncbi:hypothetical protein [Kitasatospora griseola]|uniref:hypothetical protein n=1 Tax=Kitasatospora griseola TaxID=2064 RepID=UPI0034356A87